MSVPLYCDHHFPRPIADGLRRLGVDLLNARDDGAGQVADELLLERATLLGRVFVSQDEDLLAITSRWLAEGRDFAGLIFAHQEYTQSVSPGRVIEDIRLIAESHEPEQMKNQIFYLPL